MSKGDILTDCSNNCLQGAFACELVDLNYLYYKKHTDSKQMNLLTYMLVHSYKLLQNTFNIDTNHLYFQKPM